MKRVEISFCGFLFGLPILLMSGLMTVAAALASGPPVLPGISGGVSTDSAIRQVQANIDDWQNEQTQVTPVQDSTCRDVKIIGDISQSLLKYGWVPATPIDLPAMPKLLESSEIQQGISIQDATAFAEQAFDGVALVGTEKTQLDVLLQEFGGPESSSPVDAIQLAVGAQQLAITVSNRIFSYAIQTYHDCAAVADGFGTLAGVPKGVENSCDEDTLRLSRDSAMIAASQVVVSLYQQYTAAVEAALQQEARTPN